MWLFVSQSQVRSHLAGHPNRIKQPTHDGRGTSPYGTPKHSPHFPEHFMALNLDVSRESWWWCAPENEAVLVMWPVAPCKQSLAEISQLSLPVLLERVVLMLDRIPAGPLAEPLTLNSNPKP
eukprot:scaffold231909_cov17-Tisochrysis_lutea.AAC.2